MTKYKRLTDLPIAIHETDKPTLYLSYMVLDLLEKIEDRDWYIAHIDQSKTITQNIKNMITILSDNRIIFE